MIVLLLGAPECGKTTQASRLETTLGLAKLHISDVRHDGQSAAAVAEKVAEIAGQCQAGLTLEGFPTTVQEAQAMDRALNSKGMKVSKVVYIDVGECEWLEEADPVLSLYFDRGILASVDGRPFVEAVEEQIMAAVADAAPEPDIQAEKIASYVPPAADSNKLGTAELDEVTSVRWIDPRRTVGGFTIGASVSTLPTTHASKTYQSNHRWRADLHKHERVKHDPCDKYSLPIAASMDIGWDSKRPELYRKDPDLFHPRMKSRETMYAEALILGPRHP
mmetsp:Transcript_90589/g.146609  ORF Transcript_90589/g.146609 Transcript_90589/m.146609 type:complete len:277 (+) Transcript_90589:66-896(+)